MNAARLGRMLNEAGNDRNRWAEAIHDKITDPSTGLVTKDYLGRRFAEFETRFAQLETKLTRSVPFTQIGGFIGLAILILFKMR